MALKALSSTDYQVETAEWIIVSKPTAGPASAAIEVPAHRLFRVTLDACPSGIEDMRYGTSFELAMGNVSGFASALSAIQNWVEKGEAPNRVRASGRAFPETMRPLCPCPRVARYDSGDVKGERSFSCR
jgi:hypothetical protein